MRFVNELSRKVLITDIVEMSETLFIYFTHKNQNYLLDINNHSTYLSCQKENKFVEEVFVEFDDNMNYISTHRKSLIPTNLDLERINIDDFLNYL